MVLEWLPLVNTLFNVGAAAVDEEYTPEQQEAADLMLNAIKRRMGYEEQYMPSVLENVSNFAAEASNRPRSMLWGRGIFEPQLQQRDRGVAFDSGQFAMPSPDTGPPPLPKEDDPGGWKRRGAPPEVDPTDPVGFDYDPDADVVGGAWRTAKGAAESAGDAVSSLPGYIERGIRGFDAPKPDFSSLPGYIEKGLKGFGDVVQNPLPNDLGGAWRLLKDANLPEVGVPDLGGAWRTASKVPEEIKDAFGKGWSYLEEADAPSPEWPGLGLDPSDEEAARRELSRRLGVEPGPTTTGTPLGGMGWGELPPDTPIAGDGSGADGLPGSRTQNGWLSSGINLVMDIANGNFLDPTSGRTIDEQSLTPEQREWWDGYAIAKDTASRLTPGLFEKLPPEKQAELTAVYMEAVRAHGGGFFEADSAGRSALVDAWDAMLQGGA